MFFSCSRGILQKMYPVASSLNEDLFVTSKSLSGFMFIMYLLINLSTTTQHLCHMERVDFTTELRDFLTNPLMMLYQRTGGLEHTYNTRMRWTFQNSKRVNFGLKHCSDSESNPAKLSFKIWFHSNGRKTFHNHGWNVLSLSASSSKKLFAFLCMEHSRTPWFIFTQHW